MTARKTPALKPEDACRGRHSQCGGKNPAKSASWHLCAGPGSCTEKYRAMKKAASTKPPANPTPAKITKVSTARKAPPAPPREAHSRIAALVVPTPTVAEVK